MVNILKGYAQERALKDEKLRQSSILRKKLLLYAHFSALKRFALLKVQKLVSMRKVNEYLNDKYRKQALDRLKRLLEHKRKKETNMRAAV